MDRHRNGPLRCSEGPRDRLSRTPVSLSGSPCWTGDWSERTPAQPNMDALYTATGIIRNCARSDARRTCARLSSSAPRAFLHDDHHLDFVLRIPRVTKRVGDPRRPHVELGIHPRAVRADGLEPCDVHGVPLLMSSPRCRAHSLLASTWSWCLRHNVASGEASCRVPPIPRGSMW